MRQFTPDCLIPLHVSMKDWKRFYVKIQVSDTGCWVWTACKDKHGYGRFHYGSRCDATFSHRFAYTAINGKIPDGLDLDHLCRNPLCCNPAHLEAVTHRENMLRGNTIGARNAKVTHCPHGHEYTADNIYVRKRKNRVVGRECKTCVLRREKQKRQR